MNDVKVLAVKLNAILHDITETIPLIDQQLKHSDNHATLADFRMVNGIDISEMRTLIKDEAIQLATRLELLIATAYLSDMECIHGKGKWRDIIESEKHLRISINAITSLRNSIPSLDLVTAKLLVQAYTDKLIN